MESTNGKGRDMADKVNTFGIFDLEENIILVFHDNPTILKMVQDELFTHENDQMRRQHTMLCKVDYENRRILPV